MINKIAVVAVGTAILSYLKSTHMEFTKSTFTRLSNESVEFHLCGNTLFRYGIDEDMLLREIAVALRVDY